VNLEAYLEERRLRIDATLERLLPLATGPAATIAAAMRHAVLAPGKRLRPILAIAACEACGGTLDDVLEPASALELLHTYSLVHDDLPAMDDDDLRRGRPTVHRAFSEAAAILAGDALHTLTFEILATLPTGEGAALRRTEAAAVVARRAGTNGMVGGQIADLEAEGRSPDADRLEWIHAHKTAALLAASAEVGAIHAGADDQVRAALGQYGKALGMAFQIADDLLDRTASAADLGKTPGKDLKVGKATYPALFGLEASRERAEAWVERALEPLAAIGSLSEPLRAIARFAVTRTR
jgi:geranylgeranyl diphosphate synthase, type II